MAYQRKSSKLIADAQERAANLKAIDPALDLGKSLTPSRRAAERQGMFPTSFFINQH